MDSFSYEKMSSVEDTHWWFSARRNIISAVLERLRLPNNTDILEVGCGSGGNLEMFSRFGNVYGVEYDSYALEKARDRGIGDIEQGALPYNLPFEDSSFDLVALLDVLEHIDDDAASLSTLYDRVKSGGVLLLTVPAYQWLWSSHDEIHGHKRRYTRKVLRTLVESSGFTVDRDSHFNSFLFPLVMLNW